MLKIFISFLLLFFSLSAFAGKRIIAISYFDNTTDNSKYNALSKGIADMLITDLSKISDLEIVEREKLEQLLKEIKLGNSKYFDQSTAQKLGKGLGAASILTGAFYIMDETLRIDARLINVETGKIIAAEEVTGSKRDFFNLHKQLVSLLTNAFKIKYKAQNSSLINYDNKVELNAVVNYSNALSYSDNGLEENAKEVLENTLKENPDFLFAKTKLDKLKAFIAEREKERNRLIDESIASFLKELDTSSVDFGQNTQQIWTNLMTNYDYNQILNFNEALRKNNVPLQRKMYKGSNVTFGEFMLYYDCLSLFILKKNKQLIEPSKLFLSQYPLSNFFNSVKTNLNTALTELEKEKNGKENIKNALEYSETMAYLKYLNSLGYYAYKRFIRKENFKEFKKIYIQKIINTDHSIFKNLSPYDRFDEITEFIDFAEKMEDRDLMVKIKDLAIEICADTDYEDNAYKLEDRLDDFDEEMEKHQLKLQKIRVELESNDIDKVSHAVRWFWLMRDKNEEEFIIKWSNYYLNLKDTRDAEKVYSIRLKAYENIIEALNRKGDFDEMKSVMENYNNDAFLIKNKDREYDKQGREFKGYLRNGLKEYKLFENDVLNHNIKIDLLISRAKTYQDNDQIYDEILCRKELLEKYNFKAAQKELQYYYLFLAYSKVGRFTEMRMIADQFKKEYPDSPYLSTIKSLLTYSPK